jgi:hypothetical protein
VATRPTARRHATPAATSVRDRSKTISVARVDAGMRPRRSCRAAGHRFAVNEGPTITIIDTPKHLEDDRLL